MTNTWPSGKRRAITQSEHRQWNAQHYPGTRQLCCICERPTGRCEDDSIYSNGIGPLCESCNETYHAFECTCHCQGCGSELAEFETTKTCRDCAR